MFRLLLIVGGILSFALALAKDTGS